MKRYLKIKTDSVALSDADGTGKPRITQIYTDFFIRELREFNECARRDRGTTVSVASSDADGTGKPRIAQIYTDFFIRELPACSRQARMKLMCKAGLRVVDPITSHLGGGREGACKSVSPPWGELEGAALSLGALRRCCLILPNRAVS